MSMLILNGPRVWKGWMQKCFILSGEHSVWWKVGRSQIGIFRGCFFSWPWWGGASCIFRNEICEINPWWEIKLILVKVIQSSVKVGLVLSINDASEILFSQICDKEAYLNNCAKLGSELNIWYDYLEPRNTDTHKTVLNFLQEMKNINFIESPRWVMEIERREYFIFRSPQAHPPWHAGDQVPGGGRPDAGDLRDRGGGHQDGHHHDAELDHGGPGLADQS